VRPTTRREILGAAAVGAAGAAASPAWARKLTSTRVRVGPGMFRDSVASGEPSATAVTLWSRLRTSRPRSGARLIVARDEGMRHVVKTKVVGTGNGVDGVLKTRVSGLKPHTEYFYMWESGSDVSPVGRTRTLPPANSNLPLRIGFSSCQNYPYGYFGAHAHAAAQDLDLYIFLGDYIYAERQPPYPVDPRRDTHDANDLRSYRRKYELYRTDAGLRELHRVHPTVHIWDDHEIENNYTDNRPAPSAYQRAAGYRVAFEWLPHTVDPRDRFKIYKRVRLGRMADVFLLDERQYRTVDAQDKPTHMLGDAQRDWLIAGLRNSTARWKIIANQVPIAPMDYGNGQRADAWGGYDTSRTLLLQAIEQAGIPNVVFATGDAHVYMTNLLASDPNVFADDPTHQPTAIEYLGGSITSPGGNRTEAEVQQRNPWNVQYNAFDHGYAHFALTDAALVTEYRRTDMSRPDGATVTFERFTQPNGTNRVAREAIAPPPT
jgi:alkaline phosphatase D